MMYNKTRVFPVTSNWCNCNNNGNANNNNNATEAGGVAPDSVRRHTSGFFKPSRPTQKEETSCGLALSPRKKLF